MHNSAKFALAHMLQEKNAGVGLKKCLCVRTSCCFYAVQEKNACKWTEMCSSALVFTQCKKGHEWTEKMSVCAH